MLEHGDGFEGGQRDVLRVGVGEGHMVEFDRCRAASQRHGAGALGDHRGQVEHLEDPVKGDQRGHHVDIGVGELGERAVEAVEVGGHGDQGAHLQRAVQGERPPHPYTRAVASAAVKVRATKKTRA